MQRVNSSRWGDSKSPARRCSSALLLLVIAGLLIACGSGGGGGAAVCVTGPGPAVLDWDPVSDPNLAGYHVYYGTASGTYLQQLDAQAAITYTVKNLSIGTSYYFAVTAYDISTPAKEGAFSSEVCKTITA